jgi:hypothetical protein
MKRRIYEEPRKDRKLGNKEESKKQRIVPFG